MSGIRKKFLFQLLYAFSQLTFPLITYPYITRTLGAEGLGLVGYVEYFSGFIITIASFGIPFYGVREIAKVQDDKKKKLAILQRLFSFHFFVSLIGCGIFVVLIRSNQQQEISTDLILLGCVNIILPAFIAEWYMQGIEAFAFTTLRSIFLRLAGLVALFIFVNNQEEYFTYYLIIVLVQAAVAFSNMQKIGWRGFIPRFNHESFPVKLLWHFFLSSSIISIYVFFDVLILGWIADEANVGYYTVAIRIVKLSLLMVLSINVILFPRISNLRSESNNETRVKELIEKSMQFILVLTIPLFAGFYFFAPQIISILAGDQFAPSVLIVQILSVLPLIIGFSNLFVYQVITPFGKEKKLLVCVLITCIVSLLLHVSLARVWNEQGTAIATICTELLMTALTAFVAFRTLNLNFPVTTMFQAVAAIAPFVLLVLFFENHSQNPWLLIFGCGSIGFAIYILIQHFVFRNQLVGEVVKEVKQLNRRWVNG